MDRNCRRLLYVGRRRTQTTLRRGLQELGPKVLQGLRFVCSDMWQPFLTLALTGIDPALLTEADPLVGISDGVRW
jgi:transposase